MRSKIALPATIWILVFCSISSQVITADKSSENEVENAGENFRTVLNPWPAFHVRFHQDGDVCTIISAEWVRKFRGFQDNDRNPNSELYITKKPAFQPNADTTLGPLDDSLIFDIYGKREDIVQAHVDLHCRSREYVQALNLNGPQAPEILKIKDSGDQRNRIDVVFMGDGYQASERDEFFADIARLTNEMFEQITFRSYLPLFNIWAAFVPSVDSGIGYNGPKNTPFQLYRESGELRAIYPGNARYAREVCALTGSSGCDYPSLIGNDDFYGGLGGEFVVSTRSNRTGTVVLRHEMGHNFVDVGEEYDNGYVYSGVNAASSVASLGWSHWLSGTKREERAAYRLKVYPWADLSRGTQTFTFTSDGKYNRWYMLVSVSAAGEEDSLEFTLDGEVLPWKTTGFDDREFYSWSGNAGFTSGRHTITVRSKTASTNPDIPRMICSVNIHEFGTEDEFHMDNNYVSAYPTWDYYGSKSFRPTNAGCLMRNMTHTELCNICKEGMWYQFFQRVSLIDNLTIENPSGNPDDIRRVRVNTLKLAQFRPPGSQIEGEQIKTRWFFNNAEQGGMVDQLEILAGPGNWRVEAEFVTPEVRKDSNGLLKDSASFTV